LPQITYGVEVALTSTRRQVRVTQEVEKGYEVIEASLPALVTCSKGEVVRRAPSFKDVINARNKRIRVVSANDLHLPEEQLGLQGSYTQVVKVFPPPAKKSNLLLQNLEAADAAKEIFGFLKEKRFVE